jgi:outer membrane protein assembly factor BamD (BamD/ComL family)
MKLVRSLLRAFALAPLFAGCASLPSWIPGSSSAPARLDAEEVPAAIARAREDLAAGRTESALDWMRAATAAKNLPTAQREEVQRVLEQAAGQRIAELSAPGQDPEELADLVDLGLPRQLSVQAGLAAARAQVANGEEMDAFRLLRTLDRKFPLHHERQAAGDLIVEIGLVIAQKHESFLIFYSSDSQAEEVLEYAILQHPWARRGDEAHKALADLYELHDDLDLAIDRLGKLLLDHPDSQLAPAAQAHIPELRLKLLSSPEYDRGTLLKAEDELKRWLRRYPTHELAPRVGVRLGDCLRRLCDSDLSIADYYLTIGNPFGARFHAQRAVTEAHDAGDTSRAQTAQALVDSLPPPDPSQLPPAGGAP